MTEGAAWSDTVPLNSHWKGENGILSEEKYIYNDGLASQFKTNAIFI